MIYLAGPITHSDPAVQQANVDRAARAYLTLVAHGVPALCPHLSGYIPGAFSLAYPRWINHGLAQLRRCSSIWMLPHWQHSGGSRIEYQEAERLMIDRFHTLAEVWAEYHITPDPIHQYFDDGEYA